MTKRKTQTTVKWTHDESVTLPEFIKRITAMVCGPVTTLQECDGDMWLSDLQKLASASWKLHNAVEQLEKENET